MNKVVGFGIYKHDYLEPMQVDNLKPGSYSMDITNKNIINAKEDLNLSFILVNFGDVSILLRDIHTRSSIDREIIKNNYVKLYDLSGKELGPIRVLMPHEKVTVLIKVQKRVYGVGPFDQIFSLCALYNPLDKYYSLKKDGKVICATETFIKWE